MKESSPPKDVTGNNSDASLLAGRAAVWPESGARLPPVDLPGQADSARLTTSWLTPSGSSSEVRQLPAEAEHADRTTEYRTEHAATTDSSIVAKIRALSFGNTVASFQSASLDVQRQGQEAGVRWLLCYHGSQPVGTATSLLRTTWVRGTALPCQGVADVGTVKTWRGRRIAGSGVAATMMRELIDEGRRAGAVLSALTPFRSAYYQRFGYGIVERRTHWDIPLSTIGRQPVAAEQVRFYDPGDRDLVTSLRTQVAQAGQLDMDRTPQQWAATLPVDKPVWAVVIDPRVDVGARLDGYGRLDSEIINSRPTLIVHDMILRDRSALRALLAFAATLHDEYYQVRITTAAGIDVNRLLREPQIMHHTQFSNHDTSTARPDTRLMVRVLDHRRLIDALTTPPHVSGTARIRIHEPEGGHVQITLTAAAGRTRVDELTDSADTAAVNDEPGLSDTGPPAEAVDLELRADVWAQIALGDLTTTSAIDLGLAVAAEPASIVFLDGLSHGPPPFCLEHF